MALPVVVAAGNAALRVLTPAATAALASRLGTTAAKVGSYIKNNKLATAMTVATAYPYLSSDDLAVIEQDEELKKYVEQFRHLEVDDAADSSVFAPELMDEYAAISAAARRFGGLDAFLELRKAIMCSNDTIKGYVVTRDQARQAGF